ncbi:Papain-like cysteine protease AvrRpt2 [Mycobacterium lentiflavum]|uniref:Papain-like cysteine protease AvrRpt2 n=2 Tax=Mycobacterium lentiflavum TaxID=141349 RepID=A0A0E4CM96_MYCLN|nr:Papain-like cysteine protease AvrRpt2 [Mycobacterium lentiflavum]
MFNSRMTAAVRAALVCACIGLSNVLVVSACGAAPSSTGAAATPPAVAASGTPTPARPTVSGMYGDPEAAAKYWVQQSTEDTCGLASVADVVGEVTGTPATEQQIINLAQKTPSVIRDGPIYLPTGDPGHETEKGGIDAADAVVLLDHYGIKSRMTWDKYPDEVTLSALEQDLGANRRVIAWVNGGTILDSNDQRKTADHLLVVTGVDTNNETVHLNDPYADHGNTKVSITTFMTAWKAGQQTIIVTAPAG